MLFCDSFSFFKCHQDLFNDVNLTPIQSKILVALARSKNGSLNTDEILSETGIATSTWSAEQGKLVGMGLLNKHLVRIIEQNHISKRMNYGLTEKGKMVGANLLNISKILAGDTGEPNMIERSASQESKNFETESKSAGKQLEDFGGKVDECVEVALDSFGSNLVDLVKSSMELEHRVPWIDLSEKIETFELVLRDYFGLEASEKLKKLIAANIKSRFNLGTSRSDDLSHLILEARKRRFLDAELDKNHNNSSTPIGARTED